jgi:hypothetical protein
MRVTTCDGAALREGRRGRRTRVAGAFFVSLLTASVMVAGTMTRLAASAGAVDACSSLTLADLRGVFGGKIGNATPTTTPEGMQSSCDWIWYPKPNQGNGVLLEVFAPASSESFTQLRRMAIGRIQTIKHLGDDAFAYRTVASKHVFDELWVHRALTTFRLSVIKDLGPKPLIKLARIVLTRLPVA